MKLGLIYEKKKHKKWYCTFKINVLCETCVEFCSKYMFCFLIYVFVNTGDDICLPDGTM